MTDWNNPFKPEDFDVGQLVTPTLHAFSNKHVPRYLNERAAELANARFRELAITSIRLTPEGILEGKIVKVICIEELK